MTRKNRHFSPQDKVRILKRHLVDREPISQVCSSESLAPTQFNQWQKMFFENGAAAFSKDNKKGLQSRDERISTLEGTLQGKDSVIAKLTEDNITLKKDLGET